MRMFPLTQTQSHHAAHRYKGVKLQTSAQTLNFQFFWERWRTTSSTDEIPSPNSTSPVQYHTDAFQQPPSKCTLNAYVTLEAEEGRRGRGFPNSPTRLMNIGIWKQSPTDIYAFMNIPYHMDFMPIPMSIFGLPGSIILWYLGFKWHLQLWGSDDCIQWWRHPCTWWYWILKKTMVRNEHLYSYEPLILWHLDYFVPLSRLDIFYDAFIITIFAFIWPTAPHIVWCLQLCKLHIMLN